uniref:Uncharacterized protein n=1 Tax=Tetranychus urticae TaxID=32264 RepID=T1JVI5_TETUR
MLKPVTSNNTQQIWEQLKVTFHLKEATVSMDRTGQINTQFITSIESVLNCQHGKKAKQ